MNKMVKSVMLLNVVEFYGNLGYFRDTNVFSEKSLDNKFFKLIEEVKLTIMIADYKHLPEF